MKSNVALRLEKGTILRGTTDMSRYDPREDNPWSDFQDSSHSYFHRSLIWGEDLDNIGILGPGVIDGDDAFQPWPGWTTTLTASPPSAWVTISRSPGSIRGVGNAGIEFKLASVRLPPHPLVHRRSGLTGLSGHRPW